MIENPMVIGNDKEPKRWGYCCICERSIYEGEPYKEDWTGNVFCVKCGDGSDRDRVAEDICL